MATIANIALNKPTLQSSVCSFSLFPEVKIDSQIANNGDVESANYFHTADEFDAWWQVELEGLYRIDRIRIFNRLDFQQRLRHFTLQRSLNGVDWISFARKVDDKDFDICDLKFDQADMIVGRYIRLRMDERYPLHFREMEVFGAIVDPLEVSSLDERFQEIIDLRSGSVDCDVDFVRIGAFSIRMREEYGSRVRQSMQSGNYEREERTLAANWLKAQDRVLEIGTAIGVVSMTAAAIVGARNVSTFDANPFILNDARNNFIYNDYGDIKSEVAIMRNRRNYVYDEKVDFIISDDFWGSHIDFNGLPKAEEHVIKVSTICLEDEISRGNFNVILCDIEGGEVELFAGSDLENIDLIILETHYAIVGEFATDNMFRYIIGQGLYPHLGESGKHVTVFRRHKRSV